MIASCHLTPNFDAWVLAPIASTVALLLKVKFEVIMQDNRVDPAVDAIPKSATIE